MNPDNAGLKNWRCTGLSIPVQMEYPGPPGDNGDLAWRSLLGHCVGLLYTFVGSAQHHPVIEGDKESHAVHQLLVASAGLVASEADAFLTLVAAGLEYPAEIHIRGIGENASRAVMCREYPALALELYDSAEPSWRKLAATLPVGNPPAFDSKTESDMRTLEKQQRFKDARKTVMKKLAIIDPFLWSMWSKRTHGDIYSIVQVARKLSTRGPDVRKAINAMPSEVETGVMFQSGTGFTIAVLAAIFEEFHIEARAEMNRVIEEYGRLQKRDKAAIKARILDSRERHSEFYRN